MNQRTAKLLRRYSRSTGQPLKDAKREWLTTSKDKRGDVRAEMESRLWELEVKQFMAKWKLSGREAAGHLNVPYDTWRKWTSAQNIPSKFALIALRIAMQEFKKPA